MKTLNPKPKKLWICNPVMKTLPLLRYIKKI